VIFDGVLRSGMLAGDLDEEAGSRDPGSDFWFTPLGMKTAAGVRITPDSAMRVAAVFACVKIIAETVGSLPCITYQRLERGKKRATKNPVYRRLLYKPNEAQTPQEFFEMLTGHVALRGNGYAEPIYSAKGVLAGLDPLHPDCMRVDVLENGRLGYLYTDRQRGIEYRYTQGEIFHLRGFSLDGRMGMSTLAAAAEAIGTQRAADDYASRFFANDASPRGVLTHPNHFADKEKRDAFRKAWQQAQSGVNRHKTAILEDGMKYEQLGLSNADSQLLEQRRYGIADIARFFRMPLVLLGETEKSTSWGSGIEQFMLAFVTHTMRPWFTRWEQRLCADLLIENDDAGDDEFFVEFLIDALMRGEMKNRFESYSKGILDGWLTRNEVRDKENLNPLPGLDEPLQPLNMQRAGETAEVSKPAPREEEEGDEVDARAAQVVRKETAALSRMIERAPSLPAEGLQHSVNRFYGTHAIYVAEKLRVSEATAQQICASSTREIVAAATAAGNLAEGIAEVIEAWQSGRAREIALTVRRANAQ
jgi:HK97 family phage portal protein